MITSPRNIKNNNSIKNNNPIINTIQLNNNNNTIINKNNYNQKKKKRKLNKNNSIQNSHISKKPLNKNSKKNLNKNKGNIKDKTNEDSNSLYVLNQENKGSKKEQKKKEIKLNNSELNDLKYEEAKIKDKRTCSEYYISLLKINHGILFIFNSDDFNLKINKLSIFIFDLSSLITVNAIFFTDKTMHKIYTDEGSYNFIYQLPQTIYSALISGILTAFIRFLGFSEKDVLELKKGDIKDINKRENEIISRLKLKFVLFYVINFILLITFWYYISCFCGIYKNTQIHLFNDSFLSFVTSLITPFIKYLFPAVIRIYALKRKKKCIYRFSSVLLLI